MKNIYVDLPKPFFVLAPMDDVTDTAFRRLVLTTASPDLFVTEFASADGLQSCTHTPRLSSHPQKQLQRSIADFSPGNVARDTSSEEKINSEVFLDASEDEKQARGVRCGREAVLQKLKFTEAEKPLIAQIWGKDPKRYTKTAQEIVEMGFDGLDINFGCPVPKVVKNGCCSALADNRDLAGELILAAKNGLNDEIPLSVKCRIGFNKIDLSWIEYLLKQDIAVLTIHGRTTKEMSKVPMHWEVFDEIITMRDKVAPNTLIVANGDILTRQAGLDKAKQHNLDGVMIGRGIFKDPYVFSENSPWATMGKEQRLKLFVDHINLYQESWGDDKNPSVLKKFAKVYVNGFDGASELRSELMETNSFDEMIGTLT